MSTDFKATIREDSSRVAGWLEVFGSREIPLQSPIPILSSAPGVPEAMFFLLDLREITGEQRSRLVKYLARTFQVDEREVDETLDEVGCPILDEDVTITVSHPLKWI